MAFVADNSVIVAWFVPSQANALTREAWLLARKEQVHVLVAFVPPAGALVFGIHEHADHPDFFGEPQAALQRVSQEQLADSLPLIARIHGQAGQPSNGKRKIWESTQVLGRQILSANGRHRQTVKAEDAGPSAATYVRLTFALACWRAKRCRYSSSASTPQEKAPPIVL